MQFKTHLAGIFEFLQHVLYGGVHRHLAVKPPLADFRIPTLYLTYDSQTSDTGLDTRLEAFYDMLAMKKEKMRR